MTVRIGLLLNSLVVPSWQREIILAIITDPKLSIELVVLNNGTDKPAKRRRAMYKFFMRLDRKLFKVKHDVFGQVSIGDLLAEVEQIKVVPVQNKFATEIIETDVEAIRRKNLDVLIRFGFGILKGGIQDAARLGIWSLHHGDSKVNRGGPPGFWELVNREPVTGVTLQRLSNDLDGGAVLGKAYLKTDFTSFNRNQNAVFSAGIELFSGKLKELALAGPQQFLTNAAESGGSPGFYSYPLYRDPSDYSALKIFSGFWLGRIRSSITRLFHSQQWVLLFRFRSAGIDTTINRYRQIVPPKGVDWADPFVVCKDEKYFVFFEELLAGANKAHISCLIFDSTGKRSPQTPGKVLEENHHLSYPFVFNWNETWYMIPESGETKRVWLYEAESFPGGWKRCRELIHEELYDPTPFYHNGLWYLFGTKKPFAGNSPHQYLHIYYADDLLSGQWQPHPQNPVSRDIRGSRPAGRIFIHEGRIIRPSQIGAPKYGYGIQFNEIVTLTPLEFKEQIWDQILPHWRGDLLAAHTFNTDNGMTVLDAQFVRTKLSIFSRRENR